MRGAIPIAIFLGLLLAVIVGFHHFAVAHIPPIQDAANLVSRVSTRAVELEHLRFREFAVALRQDANNFLSDLAFSLTSLILGPGRRAWGWSWGAVVAVWFAAAGALAPASERIRLLLASVLLFSCGPLVFHPGGLLDQRFDPLAVLLVSAAATALVARRPLPAAWLSLLAALAKSPALPVAAATWTAAVLTGNLDFRALGRDLRRRPGAWGALAAVGLAYLWLFLRELIAYNLSAVPAATVESQVVTFLASAARTISSVRWIYPSAITHHAPLTWLLAAGAAASLLFRRPVGDRPTRRPATFGLVLFGLLYLLFSATPPAAAVLVVWFAPAVWLLCLAVAPSIDRHPGLVCGLGAVALAGQLFHHTAGRARIGDETARDLASLRAQAHTLADALRARAIGGRVAIVTNVLYTPVPSLSYDCDAYRVLIYERLGRGAPALDGWTLGSWADDWRAEMAAFPRDEAYLTVLAVGARDEVHHRGRAAALAREFLARVNPACELPPPPPLGRPELGQVRVFFTDADLQVCR